MQHDVEGDPQYRGSYKYIKQVNANSRECWSYSLEADQETNTSSP